MRRRVRRGFEPPAYIASLIGSINDGAKAAQTGGLTMLAVAVYLVATVISTTDEVLLRGTFVQFSNIGVSVPVVASYALAPIVFLFLHVHTLIRYDMLAENLRLLDRELDTTLPRKEDQERCRQLLANVEFVQYWGSRPGSRWHSVIYKVVVWIMLVVIPILVFLATQISFLRYQDFFVTYVVHMGCLALDLAALVTFWYRQGRRKQDWQAAGRRRTLVLKAAPALALFVFSAVYLGIPPVERTTTEAPLIGRTPIEAAQHLLTFHPLDSGTCRMLGWGCRYPRLDHRLLVQEKPEGEVLFKLRTGEGDLKKLLVRVDALFLRGRSFRFADFEKSEFYDADFQDADLRQARLEDVRLQGADLESAQMQGANLWNADMQGTNLRDAQMQGAEMKGAEMQGADLRGAEMQGANLGIAQLQGADLERAELQGAYLGLAQLQGAYLGFAQLQGASLGGARMQGANLYGAEMQGANLRHAQLQGADLRAASLWQARLDERTDLSLADLRGIDFSQITQEKLPEILRLLQGIPYERRRREVTDRLKEVLALKLPPDIWPPVSVDCGNPVLVSAIDHPYLTNLKQHLSTDERAYDAALAPFLTDLARGEFYVAREIARRVVFSQSRKGFAPDPNRPLWPNLAHRLLAAEEAGAFTLDLDKDDRKTLKDLAARPSKQPAAAPAAP